jgi:hypothetical protein
MRRRERPQPASRLLQLPRAADLVAPSGLVPGDSNVNEPLEEVALFAGARSPDVLELLVRGEELACPDQG